MTEILPKIKPRPVLRYHGGKWILAPWIISHFPEHTTYVEPYAGGASVLLRKPRSYAEIINDLDGEIVNLFRVLRDQGGTLERDLKRTPFAREEFKGAYEPTDDPLERARRTIIKSAMGYGSDGIRNNTGFRSYARKERYTIPAHDWANYIDVISYTVERLQGVVIENRPALELILKQDGPDTLFYVDPPYVHSSRASKSPKRYRYEMADSDHRELARVLNMVKGKVVLSGYASQLYSELYDGWRREERAARADGARDRTEVLWLNF
jgi:DNA adenine methylase